MHIINNQIIHYNSLSLVINKIVTLKPLIGVNSQIFLSKILNLGLWGEIDVTSCVHKHELEELSVNFCILKLRLN